MEKAAGYDAYFVEEVLDYLKCVVCHHVVREPVLLVECGHRFCKTCFDDLKQFAEKGDIDLLCPTDRMKVDLNKVYDDKSIARAVMDLHVRCNNHKDGCQWTGELRNLKGHLDCLCSFTEKQRTLTMLDQLENRIRNCEKQLDLKDKELSTLQTHFTRKEEEIEMLKEQIKHTEDKLSQRISSLEDQLMSKSNGNTDFIVATQKSKRKCPSDVSAHAISHVSEETLINNIKVESPNEMLISNIKVESLNETGVLQCVAHTTCNDKTVFTWRLDDYMFHKEGTDTEAKLFSPKFLAGVSGHYLKLFVKWCGSSKSKLALGINFCRGDDGEVAQSSFDMDVKFETFGNDGSRKTGTVSACDIERHRKKVVFKPGEEIATFGWGNSNFLKMPELTNFIINNTFLITCTLIPS